MSSRTRRWAAVVAWAALILVATSAPVPASAAQTIVPAADKLVHGLLYAVLGALAARAVPSAAIAAPSALGVLVAVSVFGAVDEWHQLFIAGRYPSHADWAADTIGAGVGILAVRSLARRRREPTW